MFFKERPTTTFDVFLKYFCTWKVSIPRREAVEAVAKSTERSENATGGRHFRPRRSQVLCVSPKYTSNTREQ